ncbi:MAG: methyltransferase domain-containing protein [Candidatus Margulisiibacteriota bacterium]
MWYLSCKNGGNPPLANVGFIKSLCINGRKRAATGNNSAQVHFPEARPAGLKYLPAGIAYHLYDRAAAYLSSKLEDSLPSLVQPTFSSANSAESLLGSHIMLSQGAVLGGEQKADKAKVKEVGDLVFRIIDESTKSNNGEFDAEHFKLCLDFALSKKEETPPSADSILDYLLGSYKIEEIEEEEIEDGKYRVADQKDSIARAASTVRSALSGKELFSSVFEAAQDGFKQLWETSSHALYDRDSQELILASRAKGRDEDSPYFEWAKPEYLYEEAIRRFIETGDPVFVVDLREEYEKHKAGEQTFINPKSVENDLKVFLLNPDNPGKIVVGVYTFVDDVTRADYARNRKKNEKKALHRLRQRSIRGVFSASHRLINDERGYKRFSRFPSLMYKPPFSPNASVRDVAVNLHTNILREVAQKVSSIVGSKTVRKVWDSEKAEVRSLESAEAVSFAGFERSEVEAEAGEIEKPTSGEVVIVPSSINDLPAVKMRGFLPTKIVAVFQKIRLAWRKGANWIINWIRSFFQPTDQATLSYFFNRSGQRIAAYLDYPEGVADPASAPWVIIPPAFGKTKETTFLLALFLKKNGIGVLRYDDTNSIGESDGDIYDLTSSISTENIKTAVDYLATSVGCQKIGLVPFSLSARPAIKAAAEDERIRFLFPVVGSPNIETLLDRVYGENLIADYARGIRKGALNLLGHIVDSDEFLGDALRNGFATLETTLEDMKRVKIPIIWFGGKADPWVDRDEVKQVLDVNPHAAPREIELFTELSHRVREAGKAPELFAEIVRRIMSLVNGREIKPEEVKLPDPSEIVRVALFERSRRQKKISREEEIKQWSKYLEGYDILLKTDDYRDYLEDLWKMLDLQPGDRFLDVGCGNGNLDAYCLGKMALLKEIVGWEKGKIVGVDFVDDALARAEEKLQMVKIKRTDLPEHELTAMDIEKDNFPFESRYFDKITASLLLSYLREPQVVVERLCRSLKPGGTIILTSLKPDADISQIYHNFLQKVKQMPEGPERQELLEKGRELLNSAMGWIENEEESGRFKYFSADELKQMLRANGVEIISSQKSFGDQAIIIKGRKTS